MDYNSCDPLTFQLAPSSGYNSDCQTLSSSNFGLELFDKKKLIKLLFQHICLVI